MRKFHLFYNTKAPILAVGGQKIKSQDNFYDYPEGADIDRK